MATRQITLELTLEQEETIKALFNHNNWDYKEIKTKPGVNRQRKRKCARQTATPYPTDQEPLDVERNGEDPPEVAVPAINADECEHCFLLPCVTSRNNVWLGTGQAPCNDNSAIRRAKYATYWKIMSNLGAWNDSRYLQVKQARANGGEWAIQHRRDVMPMCILQQLRTLYPNPKNKPYMDHKWE